jgi:cytochrome c553
MKEFANMRTGTCLRWLCAAGWLSLLAQSGVALAAPDAESEYRAVIHATLDTSHGEQLFQSTCARCHGSAASGAEDGSIPALAAQQFRFLARQLVDYRHDERWDVRMEHFADFPYLVFAQDVADVAGYLAKLPRTGARIQGTGEYQSHGQSLYARRCASCHGPAGQGNDELAYPRLASQHYPYLVRQMHDALEGRRPNFSRAHVRLLSRFNRDDIDGIADYLSRLTP